MTCLMPNQILFTLMVCRDVFSLNCRMTFRQLKKTCNWLKLLFFRRHYNNDTFNFKMLRLGICHVASHMMLSEPYSKA